MFYENHEFRSNSLDTKNLLGYGVSAYLDVPVYSESNRFASSIYMYRSVYLKMNARVLQITKKPR